MMLSFLCSGLLMLRAPFLERFVCLQVLKFNAAVGVFTRAYFSLGVFT